ncbi:hypothetical protein THII_3637 [Thioploca ingrica]|uniref:FG-GAP repeat-containing protein n=1 Tax=Thioploca ingrica TaxID=40754 RepID=A0A090AK71_9GAMM|nr:hypothetical protein THII_3637 [Thioploca ingrica]
MYLGWVGTDVNHRINILSSNDGINFWNKQIYSDTSDYTPALTTCYGHLGIVWTGRDSQNHLNILTTEIIQQVATGMFFHLSQNPGHPMQADIDFSGLEYPAKFAVVGDFDGDGCQEIAVAPDASGSKGNDFWVMKYKS